MAYMRDSSGRRLDSFAVPKAQQTIVFLGDSLSEQGGMIAAAPQIKPLSPWTWGMACLGQRFKVLKNAGIGGQTSTQILARFDTDVTALNPGWVHILCGTNDVGNGTTVTKNNIVAMLDKADKAGIRVILGTIPPRLPGSYSTPAIKSDTIELNRWIITTARTRPNVILVDYFAALADVAGQYRALTAGRNPTSDGVHLSAAGGFATGLALFAALDKITTPLYPYLPVQGSGMNLLANPDMGIGTATAAPNAWTAAGSGAAGAVYSLVDRDGFPATPWKQIVVTNGSAFTLSANVSVPANGISVGDKLVAYLDYDISNLDQAAAAGQQAFFMRLKMWNGTSYTETRSTMEDYNSPMTSRKGTFYIDDYLIPAGTTIVTLEINVVGGGTYKLGRAGVYKADTFL